MVIFGKGIQIYVFGESHITKMAAAPIYDKNLQDLLQNLNSGVLES